MGAFGKVEADVDVEELNQIESGRLETRNLSKGEHRQKRQ